MRRVENPELYVFRFKFYYYQTFLHPSGPCSTIPSFKFDQMFKIFSKARSFGNSILLSPLVRKNLLVEKEKFHFVVCLFLQKSEIGKGNIFRSFIFPNMF